MDPILNPFTPGAGVEPAHLVGRSRQIDAFKVMLARLTRGQPAKSPILYGLRGVGKTVLLTHEFARLAGLERWRTIEIEARPSLDFEAVMLRELHKALLSMSATAKSKDLLHRALRGLRSFEVRHRSDGTLAVGVEVEPGLADSGDRETDMSELLVAIAEAAQDNGNGVAILIDEMQLLPRAAMEGVVAAVHEVSKRALPLAAVGAGLPQLPRLLAEAKTYAERIFDYQQVGNLDAASASDALQLPAEDAGARFAQDALESILVQSQRYPYFLQVYGSEVWNVARGPDVITADDVEVAVPLIRKDLDHGFFHVRWERATARERDYLIAMALEGDGPQTTRAVAERLGKTQGKLSVVRDRLIQKGLVYAPDHGQIDYTAPMFGEYVRRVHAPD